MLREGRQVTMLRLQDGAALQRAQRTQAAPAVTEAGLMPLADQRKVASECVAHDDACKKRQVPAARGEDGGGGRGSGRLEGLTI